MATSGGPQSGAGPSAGVERFERLERKFFVSASELCLARALSGHACRPDAEYPHSQVTSVYFDMPDLARYTESTSGEFSKDKVRVRWYDAVDARDAECRAYLEVKSRRGFASTKRRQLLPPESLRPTTDSRLPGSIDLRVLAGELAKLEHFPEAPLRPVLVVTYGRYRFTEISTGARVCLDQGIRSCPVSADGGSCGHELPLAGGVVEIKGSSVEPPTPLLEMKLLETDWSRFSKYATCMEAHLDLTGAAGDHWLSGAIGDL